MGCVIESRGDGGCLKSGGGGGCCSADLGSAISDTLLSRWRSQSLHRVKDNLFAGTVRKHGTLENDCSQYVGALVLF